MRQIITEQHPSVLKQKFAQHICQYLEIRKQNTFTIALSPTPPPHHHHHPHPDHSFPWNPAGSVDAENLEKRKTEADRSCTAMHSASKSTSYSFVGFESKGTFFSICIKKAGKILLYIWSITLKTGIITSWNFRKLGCPDFWRFWKVENWDGWQVWHWLWCIARTFKGHWLKHLTRFQTKIYAKNYTDSNNSQWKLFVELFIYRCDVLNHY